MCKFSIDVNDMVIKIMTFFCKKRPSGWSHPPTTAQSRCLATARQKSIIWIISSYWLFNFQRLSANDTAQDSNPQPPELVSFSCHWGTTEDLCQTRSLRAFSSFCLPRSRLKVPHNFEPTAPTVTPVYHWPCTSHWHLILDFQFWDLPLSQPQTLFSQIADIVFF